MKRFQGFTLIEILIALSILAVVGVMMAMGLRSAVSISARLTQKAHELTTIQTAVMIIERDLSQIINRPILDVSSQQLPGLTLRNSNQEVFFEFTRAGVVNPYSLQNRTTMQRVLYHYDGKQLIRTFWKALDRVKDTANASQVLLTQLKSFKINLIKKSEIQRTGQPSQEEFPIAVQVSFEGPFGTVTRFIKIAGEIPL